jgi:hypothetical protein
MQRLSACGDAVTRDIVTGQLSSGEDNAGGKTGALLNPQQPATRAIHG